MTTNTNPASTLAACPFCGDPQPTFTGYLERTFVMCGNCGADMDSLNCDGDVREAWNRRAGTPSAAPDDRAAFKTYLDECEEFAIVPDVAGAFNAGWQASAHPPTAQLTERQPLTEEQIVEIQRELSRRKHGCTYRSLARAIERMHGIPASGEAKSHE